MTDLQAKRLAAGKFAVLESAFHRGSVAASEALAKWIGRPSVVELHSLEQCSLAEATGLLSVGDEPICFCAAGFSGCLTGELILAFDDPSGLNLAEMLLNQPLGMSQVWSEMATSAVLETTNILGCAYLNSLSKSLAVGGESSELLPSPPSFDREFAESLMEFALMGQAVTSDNVILTRTRFEIDSTPINWTLLFVPDAQSMSRLPDLLLDSKPNPAEG